MTDFDFFGSTTRLIFKLIMNIFVFGNDFINLTHILFVEKSLRTPCWYMGFHDLKLTITFKSH